MKPFIENVLNTPHYDWLVREYQCRVANEEFSCPWHYHTEYELVLYLDPDNVFSGNYLAGDTVGQIEDKTLLLYGPGLPHMLSGKLMSSEDKPHRSIIVWLKQHWIDKLQAMVPEARNIKSLLEKSAFGMQFSQQTANKVAKLLAGVESLDRHYQSLRVMEVLVLLADDKDAQKLSVTPYRISQVTGDKEAHRKVERATQYIENHFHAAIRISDLCQALHISESSAYRLFEKHFGVSFSDHLKQFRIGKACELLANTQAPIALVAERTGFQNLSNFNRQFRSVKQMTPSQFRARFE
ncbi:AraC family transcriptional regulator [Vibrio galatheae]|uniref:AraC family transcriptional regulator n=1 Tax=Vibrio galatheae TaxID=579748 RepID=A0A0F4NIL2_9VIBR|nr:AraC family transcriptional regulator [Vibrio galatheae]KJY82955.1 AraC family transcriptional regulator [Vibrio galatheae]